MRYIDAIKNCNLKIPRIKHIPIWEEIDNKYILPDYIYISSTGYRQIIKSYGGKFYKTINLKGIKD